MALIKTRLSPFILTTSRLITNSIRLSSNKDITDDKSINIDNPIKEISVNNTPTDDVPIELENPFKKETRQCILCRLNITPNYKNYRLLSQFQSPYTGRIYGRHITGLCKKQQASVEREIVIAQNCAYMPYYYKDKTFLKDPRLFDPQNPLRPHPY